MGFIDGLVRVEPRSYEARDRVGLASMEELLSRIGNPERELACVHIAGSKGKGSTALMLEAILQSAGIRSATYTSPHLERWTERYRIDGREIDDRTFCEGLEALRAPVGEMQSLDEPPPPSFFDVLTAAGFWLFRRAGVDFAIIETGLGGRLDATNVVRPRVTCITTIELEHTDKLGPSLGAVAREKAGIMKPGVPVVVGNLPAVALKLVEERANRFGALVFRSTAGLRVEPGTTGPATMRVEIKTRGSLVAFECPLASQAMAENAASAMACASILDIAPDDELSRSATEALGRLRIPGRLELLGTRPWIIVDGAHTDASVGELARALDKIDATGQRLVVSMSRAKDAARVLAPLLRRASAVTVTSADPVRSLPAGELSSMLRRVSPGLRMEVEPNPRVAVLEAQRVVATDEVLCVTGSMYLAGIARRALLE